MGQPTVFGKYLLLERLSVGGMAEVFLAKYFGVEGFARLLAIKRVLPNLLEDEEFLRMFVDEARIAVQLAHPNVVAVHELGKYHSQYYIAMEYLQGKDLRYMQYRFHKASRAMPVPMAAHIVTKICEGLDYAHRRADEMGEPLRIVHRDVSPQNIILTYEGDLKIIDFGIARAANRVHQTQQGVLKGKFGYMAPEQVRGLPLDRRSDIYSLGVILWELVTGERLFHAASDFSILEKVRNAEVPPPTTKNDKIPPELEKVVMRALARDVSERYQWASELADDLQPFTFTAGKVFNARRLGEFMKASFKVEMEQDTDRIRRFRDVKPPSGLITGQFSTVDSQLTMDDVEQVFAHDATVPGVRLADLEREDATDTDEMLVPPTPASSEPVAAPASPKSRAPESALTEPFDGQLSVGPETGGEIEDMATVVRDIRPASRDDLPWPLKAHSDEALAELVTDEYPSVEGAASQLPTEPAGAMPEAVSDETEPVTFPDMAPADQPEQPTEPFSPVPEPSVESAPPVVVRHEGAAAPDPTVPIPPGAGIGLGAPVSGEGASSNATDSRSPRSGKQPRPVEPTRPMPRVPERTPTPMSEWDEFEDSTPWWLYLTVAFFVALPVAVGVAFAFGAISLGSPAEWLAGGESAWPPLLGGRA